jgi:hypothetical protein
MEPPPTDEELLPIRECLAGATVLTDARQRSAFTTSLMKPPPPHQLPSAAAPLTPMQARRPPPPPAMRHVYAELRDETLPELNAALAAEFAEAQQGRVQVQRELQNREELLRESRAEQKLKSMASVRTIALGEAPLPSEMAEFVASRDVGKNTAVEVAAVNLGNAMTLAAGADKSSLYTNYEVRRMMQVSASQDAARVSLLDRSKKKAQRSSHYPIVKHFDEPDIADGKKKKLTALEKWRNRMELDS